MVVDTCPDQDLQLHHDMEDRSQLTEQECIPAMLDDESVIRRFARGKKRLVINHNLQIDFAHNSLQLSTPQGELLAIHKIAERLHYILVKKDSEYAEIIQRLIAECQFIPIDTTTADRGFIRYQKYEIPEDYHLSHAPASKLWQTWQESQQQLTEGLQLDILILAKSKWYRVQSMTQIDNRLDLQTRLGLISLSLKDSIAWIAKLENVQTGASTDRTKPAIDRQNSQNNGADSDILAKIISKLAIEPESDSSFQFDSEARISRPFPQHLFDALDDQDRSSMLTENTLMSIDRRLSVGAIQVLEDYLEHGETIVKTEVVTDAQGNLISEKTITTHRGCPRWAIETILKWE